MYGRRYRLIIGKAYASQGTFSPDVPDITPTRFTGINYAIPNSLGPGAIPDIVRQEVYKIRSPEEIAQIQSAILAGFVEFNLDSYTNLYYSDPTTFEETTGFEQTENIEISEHHIEFTITKIGSNSADGNVGELTLYNLDEETATFIASTAAQKSFAEFSAGYADEGLKVLIRGNIEVVEDVTDGIERRTKVRITDGTTFLTNQMSVRAYRKGTPVRKIVEDLIQDASLPKGVVQLPPVSDVINKPLIIHGRSIEQIQRVLDARGYSVNIQDLYIEIFKRALSSEAESALNEAAALEAGPVDRVISLRVTAPEGYVMDVRLVSPDSGLIAAPTSVSDSSGLGVQEMANEPTTGIKFKHLLSGDLAPNTYVRIEAGDIRGNFRVLTVKHRGSLEGETWETEVVAEQVVHEERVRDEPTRPVIRDSNGREVEIGERMTQSEWEKERERRLLQVPVFDDAPEDWEAERRRRLQQLPTFDTRPVE